MKFEGLRRAQAKHRRALSTAVGTAVTGAVVAGALLYPGFATADVDLNDGGVWVTNENLGMVGHLNYQSRLLDGGYAANSDAFDLRQDASTVFNINSDQSKVSPVDIANVVRGTEVQLPGAAVLGMGGTTVTVTDETSGTVWITTTAQLGAFNDQEEDPVSSGPGSVAAVSPTGRVVVANPDAGTITTYDVGRDGTYDEPEIREAPELSDTGDLQIAVVGQDAVVFDPASGLVILPDGTTLTFEDTERAKLQQSGPAADHVAIATETSLIQQPLDGGDAVVTAIGNGRPAAPVRQGTCLHTAWADAATYIRDCLDEADDQQADIPNLGAESSLVFRVNRDVVVLNDVAAGDVWLVQQNLELVDNWGDIIPPKDESDEEDEESASENPVNTLPDRSGENRPPVAADDSFGARAGRTTILNVLDNDTDPDGDLLTATPAGGQPPSGTVQSIYDGAGMQIVVPADAPVGRSTFRYEIEDGRGGSASASVTVDVRGADTNEAPRAKRPTTILVEQGRSVSQNILNTWQDPDGDDLFLVSASPTPDGDQVRTRSDGLLTFRDVGKSQGLKEVEVIVSDGVEQVEGTIVFDVRANGVLPPVANFDHFTAVVGQEVQLSPLKNDLDPAGGQLSLAKADTTGGDAPITPDYDTGTIAFTPSAAGTVYVEYLVTNGPQTASGLIRVDARTSGIEGAPVAVRDVALLPRNGDVLVDVLANDTDPTGGVMVVQSVTAPDGSPLDVALLDHNILRIHDVRSLTEQTTLTYTVSNGTASATGEVSVLSVAGPETLLPPQATPDAATVRVGDVVNIPVLDNDTHPNGDILTLDPVLAQSVDVADGRIFASENVLRFVAGPTAKTVYAIYNVKDSTGQVDSAEVRITIKARDDAKNAQPVPKNLEGRAIAGSTIRIPVPLDGIDADGDSVFLVGIDSAPRQGAAVPGTNYIDFTASATGAGTDSFTYKVRDRFGLENTGTVQVGIAPAAESNQQPVAVNDGVILRPGRAIAVEALRNDSDPDGDPVQLVPEALSAAPAEMAPEIRDGRILFTAPEQQGTFNVRYQVTDGRGGTADGNITVTVDQNAELLLPIARDDRVEPSETRGETAVDVPVLDNDEDPDGVREDLEVTVDPAFTGVTVTGDDVVRVNLTPEDQLIPYEVEDIDGGVARAVIWVPSLGEQYPTLVSEAPIEVTAGEDLVLDLGELVEVREGRTPRVTVAEKVVAIGVDNQAEVIRDPATLVYGADIDYAGRGSITFEVTDGSGPDDPEGLRSTLTILTNVLPAVDRNIPPTLTSGSLEPAMAEPAVALDLRQLAFDANPEDADTLAFALEGGIPPGFEARLDGSMLEVGAADSARIGTVGQLGISVTDGEETAINTVSLTVLASSRPLAVANTDVVAKAIQGEPVTVPVFENDANPFDDAPLTIVDVIADGNGSATQQGDTVVVTPAASFVGSMTVQYTVGDRTEESNRFVTGQIQLTVEGKPGVPGTPTVESTRSRTVVMSWDPPASNGSPITNYTVTSANGVSQDCPTTTCTITGLTNNVEYVFQVTATNANGTSDPSPASAPARPDTKPDQPAPPTLVFGDRALTVNFTPPGNEGSPIEGYELQISPAPPNGAVQRSAAGGPVTWEGLENGTAYKVRVQARNAAPDPSDWSDYSAAETPAGLPGVPQAPTTTRAQSVGAQSQLAVDWNDADPNGAPVTKYQVQEYRGGALVRTLPELPASSQTITVDNAEADYSYAVRSFNRAGWSGYGAQSAPRRAVGSPAPPAPPQLVEANTGGAGRAVTITYSPLSPAQRNGARENEVSYQASFNGGGWQPVSQNQTVGGFPNGQDVAATIRALVTSDGASYTSDPGAPSAAVKPFGSPGAATASGRDAPEGDASVDLGWGPPNKANHDVARIEIRIDGGGWEAVPDSGARSVNGGYEQDHTIRVRAVNSRGTAGPEAAATARAGAEKRPDQVPTTLHGKMERSCTDTANAASYDPKKFTCDGISADREPWFYAGQNFTVGCYITHRDGYGTTGNWYRIVSSRNNGRYVDAGHTVLGQPSKASPGPC
ncbi:tandem-95 repeat protein [Arthrobacter cheniae]|uniref:Tandem-95 repeat protein n=1 Tax=Arthrobacter cheniae TaxID=1258888 RepID=A0A3A5M5L6_9MICC|nr:Ig-like domain-containing protein [Arthrobacter cheniae]RJT80871.1 tandem-95 repeat protein [Arthrobacter cheniae]